MEVDHEFIKKQIDAQVYVRGIHKKQLPRYELGASIDEKKFW